MNNFIRGRKRLFRLSAEIFLCLLPGAGMAAAHPAVHSAREQINARAIAAAGSAIDARAQKQRWRDYRYRLNVFIPGSVAAAAPCASPLQVTPLSPPQGVVSRLEYDIRCPDAGGWRVNVAVRADIFVPVAMPRTEIARGEILTADDLLLKKYNIAARPNELLFNIDDAVGMASRRNLQPGKPLTRAQLTLPVLVQRNQPVTIVASFGGINASMAGVALKNGRKGDAIKVRNSSSQRIISGVVDDVGVVKATGGEP